LIEYDPETRVWVEEIRPFVRAHRVGRADDSLDLCLRLAGPDSPNIREEKLCWAEADIAFQSDYFSQYPDRASDESRRH